MFATLVVARLKSHPSRANEAMQLDWTITQREGRLFLSLLPANGVPGLGPQSPPRPGHIVTGNSFRGRESNHDRPPRWGGGRANFTGRSPHPAGISLKRRTMFPRAFLRADPAPATAKRGRWVSSVTAATSAGKVSWATVDGRGCPVHIPADATRQSAAIQAQPRNPGVKRGRAEG